MHFVLVILVAIVTSLTDAVLTVVITTLVFAYPVNRTMTTQPPSVSMIERRQAVLVQVVTLRRHCGAIANCTC